MAYDKDIYITKDLPGHQSSNVYDAVSNTFIGNVWYETNRSQMILTPDILTALGFETGDIIKQVGFIFGFLTSGGRTNIEDMKIRMGHTTQSAFTSPFDFISATGLTECFFADVPFSSLDSSYLNATVKDWATNTTFALNELAIYTTTGVYYKSLVSSNKGHNPTTSPSQWEVYSWNMFTLTTPFTWNGTNNLIIDLERVDNDWADDSASGVELVPLLSPYNNGSIRILGSCGDGNSSPVPYGTGVGYYDTYDTGTNRLYNVRFSVDSAEGGVTYNATMFGVAI